MVKPTCRLLSTRHPYGQCYRWVDAKVQIVPMLASMESQPLQQRANSGLQWPLAKSLDVSLLRGLGACRSATTAW